MRLCKPGQWLFRSRISDVRVKCGDIYPEKKKEIGEKKKKKPHISPGTFTQWKLQALRCSSTKCPGQEEPRGREVL